MMLLTIATVLQIIVLLGLALVVLSLARQVGILHERLAPAGMTRSPAGLEPGQPLPELPLTSLGGTSVLLTGEPSALLFLTADCPICRSVLPAFAGALTRSAFRGLWVTDGLPGADGRPPDYAAYAADRGLDPECFVVSQQLGLALGIRQVPALVLVDADGRLLSRSTITGPQQLTRLLAASQATAVATPNGENSQ